MSDPERCPPSERNRYAFPEMWSYFGMHNRPTFGVRQYVVARAGGYAYGIVSLSARAWIVVRAAVSPPEVRCNMRWQYWSGDTWQDYVPGRGYFYGPRWKAAAHARLLAAMEALSR
jgi:hypothetical protein